MAGPKCPLPQYPCESNIGGRCTTLRDARFKRPCPFRKTKWEAEAARQKTVTRLMEMGLDHLLRHEDAVTAKEIRNGSK